LEAPYEDVPEHLAQPLWEWIGGSFHTWHEVREERLTEVALHMRLRLPSLDPFSAFAARANADHEFVLDLTEALLELYGYDNGRAPQLQSILVAANSAYRVRDDMRGLELTVMPEVKDQVQAVVDAASGHAGDHLRNAWNEAYGRQADPVKSYSESIKAVESAMADVVSPQNGKQTLGTMVRDITGKPSKWEFEIQNGNASGVETVLAMLKVLWDGQTSRHGGSKPTRAETVAEARAAVHLAATLVQFAVGKSFRQV
jgi:hypothetical protein